MRGEGCLIGPLSSLCAVLDMQPPFPAGRCLARPCSSCDIRTPSADSQRIRLASRRRRIARTSSSVNLACGRSAHLGDQCRPHLIALFSRRTPTDVSSRFQHAGSWHSPWHARASATVSGRARARRPGRARRALALEPDAPVAEFRAKVRPDHALVSLACHVRLEIGQRLTLRRSPCQRVPVPPLPVVVLSAQTLCSRCSSTAVHGALLGRLRHERAIRRPPPSGSPWSRQRL